MEGLLNLEIWQLGVLALLGAGAVGLAAVNFRFGLLMVGLMLFATSIGQQLTWNLRLVRTIITQLQQQRSPLYMAGGGLLLLAMAMHIQKIRWRSVSGLSLIMLMLGIYAGLIRMLATDIADGLASVLFVLVTLLPLAVVPASLIRDWWDMYALPRVIACIGLLWGGLCMVQFVVNRRALTTGYLTQRFVGMTGNPQHASAYLSFTIICCVFLVLNDPKVRYRMVWIASAAICSVLLLWTASRTGIAMTTIGVVACFYGRAGSGILLLPVVGAIGFAGYSFLAGNRVDFDLARLSGGGQTRSEAWRDLLQDFTNNPLFGLGGTGVKEGFRAEKSENSFLYGLASYGVGMGILIILFALTSMIHCLKLVRLRPSLQPYQRRLVEWLVGLHLAFWGGSMFEGYIIGRVSSPIVFMMIFAAIGQRVLELGREQVAADEYAELPADSETGFPGSDNPEGSEPLAEYPGYGDYETTGYTGR